MQLRTFIVAMLAALPFCFADAATRVIPERPNILVIVTDDQGWGDIGYNNPTNVHTPNLDQLAASGDRVLFRRRLDDGHADPVLSRVRALCGEGICRHQRGLSHRVGEPDNAVRERGGRQVGDPLGASTCGGVGR